MPNSKCSPVVNVDKYAVDAEACRQLPLDADFMNSFNNIRGGKRKSKSKRTKKNKQKGGNTGYFLDLESPTMGGLS